MRESMGRGSRLASRMMKLSAAGLPPTPKFMGAWAASSPRVGSKMIVDSTEVGGTRRGLPNRVVRILEQPRPQGAPEDRVVTGHAEHPGDVLPRFERETRRSHGGEPPQEAHTGPVPRRLETEGDGGNPAIGRCEAHGLAGARIADLAPFF